MEKASPLPFHPCVDETAHETVARLHLPVAPRCNLHCIYCTRKIGAAASTDDGIGPGRAVALLSPEEAVKKAVRFMDDWGPDSVVGIAGPGDPLANPETVETFTRIRKELPDATLCLCTNGLALPDAVEDLVRLGVGHLTVTVNGVDPAITARIQPWILEGGRRIEGEAGARILIERQLSGIERAAKAGIFVKINTVVVPGINDDHGVAIAAEVARRGAGILNPMPLIPNGGLCNTPRPSTGLMSRIHRQCSAILPTFKRCRQCRADAEGIPGKPEKNGKEIASCRKIA